MMPTLSPLSHVVIMITWASADDDTVGIMATLEFQRPGKILLDFGRVFITVVLTVLDENIIFNDILHCGPAIANVAVN